MTNVTGRRYCSYCGLYEGTGSHADLIIVLERVKGRLLCQNHRPKIKLVEVVPDETQLSFEVEKG